MKYRKKHESRRGTPSSADSGFYVKTHFMKSLLCRIVRNVLVANCCAVLPLWMAVTGGIPDKLLVDMRWDGKKPVSLVGYGQTVQGMNLGPWKGGRLWGFPMRDGMELAKLEFSLPGSLGPESVRRIEWRKGWGLSLRKKGGGLVQTDAAANRYAFADSRFDSARVASAGHAAAFWGAELLVVVLAWWFARRHAEERVKSLLPAVAGVAFALALLVQVVVPLQSFLANRSAFSFSLAELGGDMAVRFSLAFGAGALALLLLARCFGRWVLAPVLAFAVCAYLESGVLSAGFPDLRGDWSFFDHSSRGWWDAAVWAGVFAAFGGLHPFLKRHYGTAALAAGALFASSLLDVRVEPETDASQLMVRDFSPVETVIRSVKYSPDYNVLVFAIDSLAREAAHQIIEDPVDGPGLKERFSGFTEYLENVGAGYPSLFAVANLFTGDYPTDAAIFDYFVSVYSDRSVLKDYMEGGHEIAMATESLGYGYCTHPVDAPVRDGRPDCWRAPGAGGNAWTLGRVDRFRCLPFALKAPYAKDVEWDTPLAEFSPKEWTVYPILREAEVLPPGRGSFVFVHTDGVHNPVRYDRGGMVLPEPDNSEKGCVEMGIYLLKLLGDVFDVYREKGIYDKSMIIVMADHGPHVAGADGYPLPAKGRPFLWIKPAGADHPFRTSHVPTGHGQLSGLLRAASRKALSEGEIEELLQADARRFMYLRADMGPEYAEFEVDRDGKVEVRSGVLVQSLEAMRPPELRRRYSLDREEMGRNNLDIAFRDIGFWPCPKWSSHSAGFSCFLRVPDPAKRYALTLSLLSKKPGIKLAPDSVIEFRQPNRDWISFSALKRMDVVLHGLEPDADGKLEIECRRGPTFLMDVFVQSLMLEEEPGAGAATVRE